MIILTSKLLCYTKPILFEQEAVMSNTLLFNNIKLAWDALEKNEAHLLTDLLEDENHPTYHDKALTLALPQKPYVFYHDGKFYLLSRGASFDMLSPNAKEKAHQAFLTLRPRFDNLREKTKDAHQEKQQAHDKTKTTFIQHITHTHGENHALMQRLFLHLTMEEAPAMTKQTPKAPHVKPFPDTPELLPEQHSPTQGKAYDRLMLAITLTSMKEKRPDFVVADTPTPSSVPSPLKRTPM
jgi:hypothetical protein